MFKCSAFPDKLFSSQKGLIKHNKQVHTIFKETCYECKYNTFTSKRKYFSTRPVKIKNKQTEFSVRFVTNVTCQKVFNSAH